MYLYHDNLDTGTYVLDTCVNELIDGMLSCSRCMAEKQRYEGTVGDSLASLDACSGGTEGTK